VTVAGHDVADTVMAVAWSDPVPGSRKQDLMSDIATATVVAVRGDTGAHSSKVLQRSIDEVCASRGITDRRTGVEHFDSVDAAANAAATVPMFADARVVVVDEPVDKDGLAELLATVAAPSVVVIRWAGRTAPKAADGLVVISAAEPRKVADRKELLRTAAATAGLALDRSTGEALLERIGGDIADMDSAVTALLAAADGDRVDANLVHDVIREGAAANPFAFVDSIEASDTAAALTHLARISGPSGWPPLRTLGLLRKRWQGAWRISVGGPVPDGYSGQQLSRLARRVGAGRLGQGLAHIADAEAALKGGSGMDPDAVVEVCVARLSRLTR
jgi:DNA polymerase III delta subunit